MAAGRIAMPKIIFTSRYIKNPARANAGKLVKYMGTREGVEKLPDGFDHRPATKKQITLICDLIKAYPPAWDCPECMDLCRYSLVVWQLNL